MPLSVIVLFALLGAIVGSFLNVVSLRLHAARFLGGRSKCLSCGRELSPADLIPIASFLLLRGRCRHCGARIGLRYPLVELIAALVFGTLAYAIPSWPLLIALVIAYSVLLTIVLYDLDHRIVPDALVYPFIAFSLLLALFFGSPPALLAGPAFTAPFFLLAFFSRGRWMGWGDVKLALGMGWLLGFEHSLAAFFFSIWLGGAASLALLVMGRMRFFEGSPAYTMKSEIPFAPFLAAGAFIAQTSGTTLEGLLSFFEL